MAAMLVMRGRGRVIRVRSMVTSTSTSKKNVLPPRSARGGYERLDLGRGVRVYVADGAELVGECVGEGGSRGLFSRRLFLWSISYLFIFPLFFFWGEGHFFFFFTFSLFVACRTHAPRPLSFFVFFFFSSWSLMRMDGWLHSH
ncbi:hypothetical protein B0H19DRAFT_329861 [Mycena capillaripes]|nr:hypothetical protein B0H19DRAFT_329861 [Mycena capillaripes]